VQRISSSALLGLRSRACCARAISRLSHQRRSIGSSWLRRGGGSASAWACDQVPATRCQRSPVSLCSARRLKAGEVLSAYWRSASMVDQP
jgi:hypothetical protein